MSNIKHAAIPVDMQWMNDPVAWQIDGQNRLTIAAGKATNWFIDPMGGRAEASGPVAAFTPENKNFILSAKVHVDFASTFDAGALQVHAQPDHWIKLAFEYSPQGKPMIVSVVTRGTSDDCNAVPIDGREIYLRLSRSAPTFALHYSHDGAYWHMVRYFTLGQTETIKVGFAAQSPTGTGCTAVFSEINFRYETLTDLRGGQ